MMADCKEIVSAPKSVRNMPTAYIADGIYCTVRLMGGSSKTGTRTRTLSPVGNYRVVIRKV